MGHQAGGLMDDSPDPLVEDVHAQSLKNVSAPEAWSRGAPGGHERLMLEVQKNKSLPPQYLLVLGSRVRWSQYNCGQS